MSLLAGNPPGDFGGAIPPIQHPTSPNPQGPGVSTGGSGSGLPENLFLEGINNFRNIAALGQQYNQNLARAQAGQAGTVDGLQAQNAWDVNSLNLQQQQYANQQGSLEDAYNNAMQGNQLDIYNNGVQYAGAQRDSDYYNNTLATQTGRYNDQTSYLNSLYGFNDQTLGNELTRANTDSSLGNQLQGIQGQSALITQQQADRQARYAAEANGGGTTQASYGANLGTDAQTYANALAQAANTNAGTQNTDRYRIATANTSHGQTAAGIGDQMSSAKYGYWQNGLDNAEQQGKISDSQKQLFANALQLGLNGNQLTDALNHNLTGLNLTNQGSIGQAYTDLLKNNASLNQLNLEAQKQAASQTAADQKPPPKPKKK